MQARLQSIQASGFTGGLAFAVRVAFGGAVVHLYHLNMNLAIPVQAVTLLHQLWAARAFSVLLVFPVG